MKYETIGGAIHDTNHSLTTLRELRVGDKFRNKQGVLFEVWGDKCVFNPGAGSATRKCKNLETGQIESKVCRIQVTKT
jgi:hypothetical protein